MLPLESLFITLSDKLESFLFVIPLLLSYVSCTHKHFLSLSAEPQFLSLLAIMQKFDPVQISIIRIQLLIFKSHHLIMLELLINRHYQFLLHYFAQTPLIRQVAVFIQ